MSATVAKRTERAGAWKAIMGVAVRQGPLDSIMSTREARRNECAREVSRVCDEESPAAGCGCSERDAAETHRLPPMIEWTLDSCHTSRYHDLMTKPRALHASYLQQQAVYN
jgi:hypothetical protein